MTQSKKTKRAPPKRLRAPPKRSKRSRMNIHKQRWSPSHHGGNTYTFDSDDRRVESEVISIIDDDRFPRQQRELIQRYPYLIKSINGFVRELVISKLATNNSSMSQQYDTQIKSAIQYILKGFTLAMERSKKIGLLILEKLERKEGRSAFGRLTHSLKKRISGIRSSSGKTLRELEKELENLIPDETVRNNFIKNLREKRTMEKQIEESRQISEIMSRPLEPSRRVHNSSRRVPRSSVSRPL